MTVPALYLLMTLSSQEHLTLVLDLEAGNGVAKELAQVLSEAAVADVRQVAQGKVMGSNELRTLMDFEKQRNLLGCKDDTGCYTEIGNALGAKEIVTGSLSKVGDRYLLLMRRVDVSHSAVLQEGTRTRKVSEEGDLLADLADLVRQLFAVSASADARPAAVPSTAVLAPIGTDAERVACARGDATSCYFLGVDLTRAKRAAEAVGVLQRACTLGNMNGCGYLAGIYEKGAKGVAVDEAQASTLYRLACQGVGQAGTDAVWPVCASLAIRAFMGYREPKDPAKGLALLERGCGNSDKGSCLYLGRIYAGRLYRGFGVPPDAAKAKSLLQPLCDDEYMDACVELHLLKP